MKAQFAQQVVKTGLGFSLSLFAAMSHAASWFDANSKSAVTVGSTSYHAATELNKVTVKCPKAGFIAANATANMNVYSSVGGYQYLSAGFSIAINDPQPISMHAGSLHYISDYASGITTSAGTQRIAACKAGQTLNVSFVAYRDNSETSLYVTNPTLVVQFFDNKI